MIRDWEGELGQDKEEGKRRIIRRKLVNRQKDQFYIPNRFSGETTPQRDDEALDGLAKDESH